MLPRHHGRRTALSSGERTWRWRSWSSRDARATWVRWCRRQLQRQHQRQRQPCHAYRTRPSWILRAPWDHEHVQRHARDVPACSRLSLQAQHSARVLARDNDRTPSPAPPRILRTWHRCLLEIRERRRRHAHKPCRWLDLVQRMPRKCHGSPFRLLQAASGSDDLHRPT